MKAKAKEIDKDQVYGWAWEIKVGTRWKLCEWMEPDKITLMNGGAPSLEARPVCVVMQRAKRHLR